MEKRKIYGTIIGVIAFLILIIGATYAFFGWRSTDNINVNLTVVSKNLEKYINYNQGVSILDTTGEALVPVDSYNEGVSTTIEFWKDPSYTRPIYGEISLEVLNLLSKTDSSDTNIAKTDTIKWAITTYNINDSTEVLLREGSFNGKKIGDKWAISSDFELNGYQTFYKIYLWIDIMAIDKNLSIEGELLSTEVSASASDTISVYDMPPNAPALTDNLVPVYFDEEVGTWKTASYTNEDNGWYNYDEKKWANAVLLTETKRNSLTKDTDGNYAKDQIIGDSYDSGTLAFYVWIPRYKYRVWNIDKIPGTDSYGAYDKGIDIIFESETNTTGTIECNYRFDVTATEKVKNEECSGKNGEYYTHPAFTFGSDELTGFWMGKFHVSSIGGTDKNNGGGGINGAVIYDNIDPLILPNNISWRYSNINSFWKNIYNMSNENNIYGLNSDKNKVDSHLIKSIEWGALTYLSHSKYGICANGVCNEIFINNTGVPEERNQRYYTGRSSGKAFVNTTINKYGSYTYDGRSINSTDGTISNTITDLSLGTKASSTGNIYGVYDVAGGACLRVMGNMGAYTTEKKYIYESNLDEEYFTYEGNEKYITTYAYGTTGQDQTASNRTRLGDATAEVKLQNDTSWYGSENSILHNKGGVNYSWMVKSGNNLSANNTFLNKPGMFLAMSTYDGRGTNMSTRTVLVVIE